MRFHFFPFPRGPTQAMGEWGKLRTDMSVWARALKWPATASSTDHGEQSASIWQRGRLVYPHDLPVHALQNCSKPSIHLRNSSFHLQTYALKTMQFQVICFLSHQLFSAFKVQPTLLGTLLFCRCKFYLTMFWNYPTWYIINNLGILSIYFPGTSLFG